ncbi:MAG: TonB-dependent receptor [Bacteroidales bacterium]|jgi:outer membrane receptor protein involved in Fe transport|nr:TonB-dependent receptor [Bacteroidales bacterium]
MNTLSREINKSLSLKKLIISSYLLYLFCFSYSQEISIKCTEEPLNQLLINLRSEYGLMLSFDDSHLSSFKLSCDTAFASAEKAIDFLLLGLPLRHEINNGVYIIYPFRIKEKPKKYIISGRITDKTNQETLPFSGIQINNTVLGSDAKGNFSLTSTTDSIFNVKISYIGYYILDTIVNAGTNNNFNLMPSVIALQEVVVKGAVVAQTIQAGSSPGIIRLNHKIAYYLPGNGDNSIFNLLRLQPGILAAGEQSADLIIWGSYEGHSQIIFDGFTLYGMKNFNDNISAINPFMAKDIKVLKGGFGAEYGERVGGIVDITGVDGNRLEPSAQFCINNMTVNGMASIPFQKKSALLLAYRQTYYDLYNPVMFSTSSYGRGRQNSQADYYLTPDYKFRDINLKYSGSSTNTNYYISLYGGRDNFSYAFDQETFQKTITLDHNEKNNQLGGSAFYGLRWKDKHTSNFIASFSSLQTARTHNEDIIRTSGPQVSTSIHNIYDLSINEVNGRIENTFSISEKHQIDAGVGVLNYFTDRDETSMLYSIKDEKINLTLPYFYLQDNINLHKKITIKPGIRLDYHSTAGKIFFQPRLSLLYRINDYLKINSAAGTYNQFVAKNMIIETLGDYRLAWSVCDNNEVSVLSSKSLTCGLTYNKKGFIFSAEGYLKRTGAITRFLETDSGTDLYEGDSKTKGLDIFIKKDFKDQTIWISYTLSKTLEYFPYFPTMEYIPAMHDQRHELKFAGLTRYKSLHLSVNYVFGSGFPDPDQLPALIDYMQPYSRLDAALIYKLSKRRVHLDAGISVLNVLNRENIRYSNYTRIPTNETTTISLYAEAVPLTPTIFLNIYF